MSYMKHHLNHNGTTRMPQEQQKCKGATDFSHEVEVCCRATTVKLCFIRVDFLHSHESLSNVVCLVKMEQLIYLCTLRFHDMHDRRISWHSFYLSHNMKICNVILQIDGDKEFRTKDIYRDTAATTTTIIMTATTTLTTTRSKTTQENSNT